MPLAGQKPVCLFQEHASKDCSVTEDRQASTVPASANDRNWRVFSPNTELDLIPCAGVHSQVLASVEEVAIRFWKVGLGRLDVEVDAHARPVPDVDEAVLARSGRAAPRRCRTTTPGLPIGYSKAM